MRKLHGDGEEEDVRGVRSIKGRRFFSQERSENSQGTGR